MPIRHRINRLRKLVVAEPHGTLTGDDLVAYQREVWSRADLSGFSELIDMARVESLDYESMQKVKELAKLSAAMDRSPGKIAVVATDEIQIGLARMYGALRAANPGSQKQVETFRTRDEAMKWLVSSDDAPAVRVERPKKRPRKSRRR